MSLLPQQIPPQTAIIGTGIDKSGNVISVTMDQNWWLFFYNIAKQVLSAPTGPLPVTPTVASFTFSDDDAVLPNPAPFTSVDWLGP